MTTPPAVEVRGLTKRYGRRSVVDDLSFDVRAGRVTAFLGPNGAGKTTTIHAILGLIRPDDGTTAVGGVPVRAMARPWAHVGAVLDGAAPHPKHSGSTHLQVMCAALGLPSSRVAEVLGLVDMTSHQWRHTRDYSLGMKQRLNLAAALVADPDVLVLDEPANGLDPAGHQWLRQFLCAFADTGRTVLMSSHLLSDVALIADDLVVIDNGRLLWSGPAHQLQRDAVVLVRASDPHRLAEGLRHSATIVNDDSDVLTVTGVTSDEVGTVAARLGVTVFELTSRQRSLEEAFLTMTSQKAEK